MPEKLPIKQKIEVVLEEEPEKEQEQVENLDYHTLSFIKAGHIDIPDMANFDPARSLAEVKDFNKHLSKENSSSVRASMMRDFRKKLKIFRGNMAEAQAAMEGIIIENPDKDFQKLAQEVDKILDHYNLQSQSDNFIEALKNYVDGHMVVESVVSFYRRNVGKNWQNALFAKLFGKFPEDTVEVEVLPMSLFFKIYNEFDYALAYHQHEPDELELKNSNSSSGATIHRTLPIEGLGGKVIIGNNSHGRLDVDSEEEDLKIHEEEHVIHQGLFPTSAMVREERESDFLTGYEGEIDSYEFFVKKIKKFSHNFARRWEKRSKEEVLSWFKEGNLTLGEISEILLSPDHLYNYIKIWEDDTEFIRIISGHLKRIGVSVMGKNRELLEQEVIEKVALKVINEAWELYKKKLTKALKAAESLREQYEGDPAGDVKFLRLISQEPLDKWHRLSKLMTQ